MSIQQQSGLPGAMARGVARLQAEEARYTQDEERLLGPFTGIMAAYSATVGVLGLLVRASGRRLPDRIGLADLALISVATHKLARLLSKEPVTHPLRAPFTRVQGNSDEQEFTEQPGGNGLRKALGKLLSCPFCIDQWVATGFVFGLVLAPRATRLVASLFAAVTGADFLQYAYAATQQKTESQST
jgi:hypothetical protein